MQILSLSLPKCNTCMVARRSDLYGRLPKAPFFLRQSASPSLAPAFTTHNRDEVATPFVYIRGKILPTASAISLKLAKRLTRSALQASARTRLIAALWQAPVHPPSVSIRVHPWTFLIIIRVNSCTFVKRKKHSRVVRIPAITICIIISCAAAHNSQLTTHNCDEVAPPSLPLSLLPAPPAPPDALLH